MRYEGWVKKSHESVPFSGRYRPRFAWVLKLGCVGYKTHLFITIIALMVLIGGKSSHSKKQAFCRGKIMLWNYVWMNKIRKTNKLSIKSGKIIMWKFPFKLVKTQFSRRFSTREDPLPHMRHSREGKIKITNEGKFRRLKKRNDNTLMTRDELPPS